MTEESQDTLFEPRKSEVTGTWVDKDGNEHTWYNEELMLAKLLVDEVCFLNTRVYVDICWPLTKENKNKYNYEGYKDKNYQEDLYKIAVVFVICNDFWSWGCADAEPITTTEIPELYKMHMADKKWGVVKWACKKRNLQPQRPIIRDMKKEGAWCDLMESLPKNNE